MAKPRPTTITCKGCGDPDVPVADKGGLPTFCFDCAGFPRNPAHVGWNAQRLDQHRRERRRQRLAQGDVVDLDFVAGEEEETHDHAAEVADTQVAAQAYWGGGQLQPPDGPVTLNTPVGDRQPYDPANDPLVGDVGPVWADEALDSADLVDDFEPDVTVDVGPVVVEDPDEAPDLPHGPSAVCIAAGCELPRPGHGHDLFCRGHWRLVSLETRQRVLGAPYGPARNSAVHRALFEIRRRTGG